MGWWTGGRVACMPAQPPGARHFPAPCFQHTFHLHSGVLPSSAKHCAPCALLPLPPTHPHHHTPTPPFLPQAYSNSLVDHHLVLDLVPPLARAYFAGRLPAPLSYSQAAILACIGLQQHEIGKVRAQPPWGPLQGPGLGRVF